MLTSTGPATPQRTLLASPRFLLARSPIRIVLLVPSVISRICVREIVPKMPRVDVPAYMPLTESPRQSRYDCVAMFWYFDRLFGSEGQR